MYFFQIFSVLLYISTVFGDWVGPTYAPPNDISSDESILPKSWKKLSETLDGYLKDPTSAPKITLGLLPNLAFSIGTFSLRDSAAAKLQYHYTSPEIANSQNGTTKVDGDSIYKLASVSKLITAYAGMIELTDADWNRPLTEIFPLLAEPPGANFWGNELTFAFQWDQVTAHALVTPMAGISALGLLAADQLVADLKAQNETGQGSKFGFPPIDPSELGPFDLEDAVFVGKPLDFLRCLRPLSPAFQTYSSPVYSNTGFGIIGIIIAGMTGKSIEAVYQDTIFGPLGMKSSSGTTPTDPKQIARSVVSANTDAGFFLPGGITVPSGSVFSTLNDLNRLGVALLNSTLLPANVTRRWMRPATHTASLSYDLGGPWEIVRYIHATGKVTDIYTKLGDSGPYGSLVAVIPDYDAGFCMLNSWEDVMPRGDVANGLLDVLTEAVVPTLEAQAEAEAIRNYVGTYVSTGPSLDSSLTIAFNESTAAGAVDGLALTSWISNGTDTLTAIFGKLRPRILPTIRDHPVDSPGKNTFRASSNYKQLPAYTEAESETDIGLFSGQYLTNQDWLSAAGATFYYGGVSMDLFVFDVDADGVPVAVSPAAARITLKKRK